VGSLGGSPHILISDDQPDILESLRLLLKPEGYLIETVDSPDRALAAVAAGDFDAALVDLNYSRDTTSGSEGLELLEKLQTLDSTLPVVVMTAWGSVEVAVQAIRLGARDFIEKPWDNEDLMLIIRNGLEKQKLLKKLQEKITEINSAYGELQSMHHEILKTFV